MTAVSRHTLAEQLDFSIEHFRVTALLGPRQCGKTTLARTWNVPRENYFDLEDPLDQSRLQNRRDVLGNLTGLVIVDEFQWQPDLFPVLRVLADRRDPPARFLILGSASPQILQVVWSTMRFSSGERTAGRRWISSSSAAASGMASNSR
ncbi:MAG: AAA family ATPase [Luteolibacter sp.]